MDVFHWTAAPFLAARHELELDDALRAEGDGDDAVEVLGGGGEDHADRLAQRSLHLGLQHHVRDVRRPDLLLTLGDEDEVDRHLLVRAADGMQRGEKRRFRPLLIIRAPAHHHLAYARILYYACLALRIGLLR